MALKIWGIGGLGVAALELGEDVGLGLTPAVEDAVQRALALVTETLDELRTDAAYQR